MVLNDHLKDKTIQVAVIAGLIGGAISYWFQPYNERQLLGVDIYLLMGILAFVASMGIGLVRRTGWLKIAVFVCAGFVVSMMGRIFFDGTFIDKTHHNLWPFEILYALGVLVPASAVGVLFAYLIKIARS